MPEMITLSVIIVNWNVRNLLVDCLRSLFAYNTPLALEAYVVDNHSTDGSVELLKRDFPQVKLIVNDKNIGFSRANNQGIHQAQGRYILLLNPDTVWVDDSLRRMVIFMDSHPEIGVIGPKLLNSDRQSIQYWGARKLPRPLDTFFEYTKLSSLFPSNHLLGRYRMEYWDHADSREVDCLSGACLLIRRETIQEVGLLDEIYSLYWEDTDWCHRVVLSRLKIYYWTEAQLVHLGGQSSLQNRGPSVVMFVRGAYLYFRKFYGFTGALRVWLLLWPASLAKLLAWSIIAILRSTSRELAFKQLKAYWTICLLFPSAGNS